MTRYEHGFLTKCAEYGVDARTGVMLMKKRASIPGPMLTEVAGGALNAGGHAVSGAARKIPWGKILAALGIGGTGAGALYYATRGGGSDAPVPAPVPAPSTEAPKSGVDPKILAALAALGIGGAGAYALSRDKKKKKRSDDR